MATDIRAHLHLADISAQKARLVVDMVRGKAAVDAENTLVESHVPWKQRKARVDKLAAQTILQAYLDEQRRPKLEPRHAADD